MRTLEGKVEDVLEDLGIPFLGVETSGETVIVALDGNWSIHETIQKIQGDPRYDSHYYPHSQGFHLLFENVSDPQTRSLLDYSLDFRGERGRLLSVKAYLKMGRIFSSTGKQIVCLSIQSFFSELENDSEEQAISRGVDSLE